MRYIHCISETPEHFHRCVHLANEEPEARAEDRDSPKVTWETAESLLDCKLVSPKVAKPDPPPFRAQREEAAQEGGAGAP